MPQMAPISWLILFTLFSVIFIIFNIMNYFCFFYKSLSNNNKPQNKPFNNNLTWKW